METIESKEMTEFKEERKLNKPLLIAGILLGISWIFYVLYFSFVLPSAFKAGAVNWEFAFTAVDFLATLAIVLLVILAALKPSRIKFLVYPVLVSAAISIYSIVMTIMDYGFSSLDMYYYFRNITLVIGLVLFSIYTVRKSIAIVFSAVFITFSSVFGLWYNIEHLFSSFQYSSSIGTIFAYFMLIFLTLGTLVLVWTCCVMLPAQKNDKDIIKKNIALSIVLSVFTLGVYSVFWVKSITEDVAKLENAEVNSSLETAMFFIIPFFAIYWLFDKGKKMTDLADDADMSVLYAVQGFFLLCFFSLALIQNQIHKAVGLAK